ncbi:MarR family transcriptional regulator, partial [Mesorhizobium sp. M2D.F.Ca.ET.223.01.1.1]
AEASLRPVTYAMLALIDERPGIRAAELCRLLGMKSANMAPLLAELEERGLIERDDHAEDKRVRKLSLTEAAKAAMPAWRLKVRRHENRFLQRLS